MMDKYKMIPGAECSKNFLLDKRIETVAELDEALNNHPSIFWRHRPYPSAVIVNLSLAILRMGIRHGIFWTIKPKINNK